MWIPSTKEQSLPQCTQLWEENTEWRGRDTCTASQISRSNIADQWSDTCHSQISGPPFYLFCFVFEKRANVAKTGLELARENLFLFSVLSVCVFLFSVLILSLSPPPPMCVFADGPMCLCVD